MSLPDLLRLGLGVVLFVIFLRRRRAEPTLPAHVRVDAPSGLDESSSGDSDLARGVRDIRQTDPGFEPSRFAGYTGMVFREAQSAWKTRTVQSLRDRVTPEMYGELQAQCDRLRSARQSKCVEQIEIRAEITEAWQESGQDYVTAYIGGSIVDYTVDEASDGVVEGSRTIPTDIEEFWTFTRPAGLNFWMLSAIQAS